MKSSTVPRRLNHLHASVRELVRHTADSLGISLEIWDGPGRPPERFGLSNACRACEQEQSRVFDRCRKRRTYLSRREVTLPLELAEKCPVKLRLARLATAPEEAGPTLFGFGYTGEGGETQQDMRVLSFLRDLRRMLAEASEVQTEMSRMTHELVSQSEEMDLLHSVSGRLAGAENLHRTVVQVLSEWRQVIEGQCAFLWLRDQVRLEFAFAPQIPTAIDAQTHQVWENFARRLAETLEKSGHDSHVERLGAQHPISKALAGDCECIAVPLVVDRSMRGILCGLRQGTQDDFGTGEVRLLRSLAAQLGMAITNTELYADLKGFLTNTVKTLVSAIDAKDPYTAGHSERVNIVSMLLGNEMGLDLNDLEALYWGSLLHDVGKIGMPESILNKPGALAPEEVQVVMEHPERGWELLHAIEQLGAATDGVRAHHEWWNGEGYPQGLVGESIPLIARIISVADAFDALISNRSYRRARTAAQALGIIDESTGTQFDPTVVAALHRLQPLLDKHQWVLMSGQRGGLGTR
jgi:hypothetical protein